MQKILALTLVMATMYAPGNTGFASSVSPAAGIVLAVIIVFLVVALFFLVKSSKG